jgi:hypothetical protein
VMHSIEHHLAGVRAPLSLLNTDPSVYD